jgi:hypothetical protein
MKVFSVLLIASLVLPVSFSRPASGADSQTVLKQLLAEQEVQLGAALSDLTLAETALKTARHNKLVNRGIAIVVAHRLLKQPVAAEVAAEGKLARALQFGGKALEALPKLIGPTATKVLSVTAIGAGSYAIVVAGSDVPKWEEAVAERRTLVEQALERVTQLRKKLEGEKK